MANVLWHELRDALQQRLEIVGDRSFYERDPSGHLKKLRDASASLDRLIGDLPGDTDPMLRHYLERQSYVKALDWLESQPA